jgi:predicted  nucleic acid-binding Zn-ribbon protein
MHFEIWWPFAFVLGLAGIQAVQKIAISLIERRKSASPPALEGLVQNVERINQALDAIAVEVERIGESQRFLTKVMSSTEAQLATLRGS